MSSVSILGDTSGSVLLQAPAVAGSTTLTLPSGANGTIAAQGVSTNIVSGTPITTTSGTAATFTGIPSWVKRITYIANSVQYSGSAGIRFQVGTSASGIITTGYVSSTAYCGASQAGNASTSGFDSSGWNSSANIFNIVMTLVTLGSNKWNASCMFQTATQSYMSMIGGQISLSSALDRVTLTSQNGTDTFVAGTVNILYE